MQSQNYFYRQLLNAPIDVIIEAVKIMPEMSQSTKDQITKAIAEAQTCSACDDLANWLYNSLTLNSLGIDRERAIWKNWASIIRAKK